MPAHTRPLLKGPSVCLSWVTWDMGALSQLRSQGGGAAVLAKDSPTFGGESRTDSLYV